MKTLFTLLVSLVSLGSMAQVTIYKTVPNATDLKNSIDSGQAKQVSNVKAKYVKVQSRSSEAVCYYEIIENAAIHDSLICVSPEVFDAKHQPIYSKFKGFRTGFYTVPVKLRGVGSSARPFDFETDIALQASFIFGFGSIKEERSKFDFSIGIGTSVVSLDNLNSEVTELRTASAFSWSAGFIFEPSASVNIGVFTGFDYLGRKDQSINWIYNKRPWLGLGINIGLQEISASKSPGPKTIEKLTQ